MNNLLFEIIPPPKEWPQEKMASWVDQVCRMIDANEICMVNIPEVVSEIRDEKRTVPYTVKIDNLEFAKLILHKSPDVVPVINKICVRQPLDQLLENVNLIHSAGIRRLVLVGGEHSVIRYPGPSVTKAAAIIKERYPDIQLGGITIFTRRDEAGKIEAKHAHGIDFFISQIIYETANMKRVMLNLQKSYKEKGQSLPKIFLSLAPATKKSDITFMQWLGVEFPSAILSYFVDEEEASLEKRVFEVTQLNLDEIQFFIQQSGIELGFNLEQVMYSNTEAISKLIQEVKKRFS